MRNIVSSGGTAWSWERHYLNFCTDLLFEAEVLSHHAMEALLWHSCLDSSPPLFLLITFGPQLVSEQTG